MSVEEMPQETLIEDGSFELRRVKTHIVAETVVEADMEDAGDRAFRRLFDYISGENESQAEISMTTPVTQEQEGGEKISMTAPVLQEREGGSSYRVAFVMPEKWTLDTLPAPKDDRIRLVEVPERQMAVIRYRGRWTESQYRDNLDKLQDWIRTQGWEPVGDPVWARYNPPFMPAFLRRNEIMIPVSLPPHQHQ